MWGCAAPRRRLPHRMPRRCCPVGTAWEILWTVLCVVGLALAGWWLFGLLLRPLPGPEARVLLGGRGAGEHLEQQVRAFVWLRGMGLVRCPILIADVDLTPEGRELALRLVARWPGVVLWPVEELPDYIERG